MDAGAAWAEKPRDAARYAEGIDGQCSSQVTARESPLAALLDPAGMPSTPLRLEEAGATRDRRRSGAAAASLRAARRAGLQQRLARQRTAANTPPSAPLRALRDATPIAETRRTSAAAQPARRQCPDGPKAPCHCSPHHIYTGTILTTVCQGFGLGLMGTDDRPQCHSE